MTFFLYTAEELALRVCLADEALQWNLIGFFLFVFCGFVMKGIFSLVSEAFSISVSVNGSDTMC